MALGSILKEFGIKLTLDFDAKKAEEAKKRVAEIGKEMRDVALHVAEASAAIFEFANLAGENSRALEENSQMLGINVERLQELEYAAKVAANVGRGELVGALEQISSTLDKARHSNIEAGQSLIRLGVPIDMLTNKSITADQVMMVLADRFKGIQDPAAKLRLATEVGGAGFAKLLPLLNQGSAAFGKLGKEARDLGVILSEETIQKGAEFDRQFSRIWIVIKNLTFTIGNELIKYLRPMVIEFQRFVVANKQFIATGIATVMKSLGYYLEIVFKTVKFVADRFQYLVRTLGGVERVSKAVAIALGVISGAKIVSALGTLVTSFRAVGAALGLIEAESLVIGAALLALILVIQDLFSDDSIIKEWIGMFGEEFPNAMKFLKGSIAGAVDFFRELVDEVKTAVEWFLKAIGIIGDFASAVDKALSITQGFKMIGDYIGKGIGAAGDFMLAHSSPQAQAVASSFGGGGGGSTQMNKIEVNQTIQVPPGTTAEQGAKIVGGSLSAGLGPHLRQTKAQAVGGQAY